MQVVQFVLAHQAAFASIGLIVLQEFIAGFSFIKGNSICQALYAYAVQFLQSKGAQAGK